MNFDRRLFSVSLPLSLAATLLAAAVVTTSATAFADNSNVLGQAEKEGQATSKIGGSTEFLNEQNTAGVPIAKTAATPPLEGAKQLPRNSQPKDTADKELHAKYKPAAPIDSSGGSSGDSSMDEE